MDSLIVTIKDVVSVTDNINTVEVEIDTVCWNVAKRKKCAFLKNHWYDRISICRAYDEREEISLNRLDYIEHMGNDEFFKRFEKTVKDFTDQEIADEFNRRLRLHRVAVECVARTNS